MIYMPIAAALIGLAYMLIKRSWVLKQDAGDGKMAEISSHIYEGALAFLKAEYKLLAIFVLVSSVLLAIVSQVVESTSILIVVAFIFGAVFSALSRKHGYEDCNKNKCKNHSSRKNKPATMH